jgi:hypothetical protein
MQKFARKKLHNALALPILIYGNEIGTIKIIQNERSTAIKFFRIAAEYFLFDHK